MGGRSFSSALAFLYLLPLLVCTLLSLEADSGFEGELHHRGEGVLSVL